MAHHPRAMLSTTSPKKQIPSSPNTLTIVITRNTFLPILLLAMLLATPPAPAATPANVAQPVLIPEPVSLSVTGGSFTITPATRVLHTPGDARLADASAYLARRLSQAFDRKVVAASTESAGSPAGAILLTTKGADASLGSEGYALSVTNEGVVIRAPKAAGAFYGAITLLQLAPPEAFRGQALVEGKPGGNLSKPAPRPCDKPNVSGAGPVKSLAVPCAEITDQPRFAWRGLLIDPARHFWTIDELKHYVDYMALHKLNALQIHLTDHENWCVEIMQYPQLTPEKAMNEADPQRLTGQTYHKLARHYYTQEELKSLVAYAAKRFVNIVPEIEMPGHAGALRRAKISPSCIVDGRDAGRHEICPGNEQSYVVLQNILDEVLAIFPSQFIHIGADECSKRHWSKCSECGTRMKSEGLKDVTQLHGYFVGRMSEYIQKKGRTLVGWDEILESGAKAGAIGMYWRSGISDKLIKKAAKNGQRLVMTPTAHFYFDYVQSPDKDSEPVGFLSSVNTLKTAYAMDPVPEAIRQIDPSLVLGVQATLWGECMKSFPHVLYMTWPRACAMSEIGWSPERPRNYPGFHHRLQTHLKRLDAAGIKYRKPNAIDLPD
jgi:hexosaminidase